MNPPPSEDRLLSPEQIDRQLASLAVEADDVVTRRHHNGPNPCRHRERRRRQGINTL